MHNSSINKFLKKNLILICIDGGRVDRAKNSSIIQNFRKENSTGNKANVVVSSEKPAILTYKVKTGACHMQVKYEIINKYGNICSY